MIKRVSSLLCVLTLTCSVVGSACKDKKETTAVDGGGDPCDGVVCSGHGQCVEIGGAAVCQCESGYHPEGLACVRDVLPTCGNDTTEPGEACDGTDVTPSDCISFPGFAGGTLACETDCSGYDLSGCTAGQTINALSCSLADVRTALDAAGDGDTVAVPAGTCTWPAGDHILCNGNNATVCFDKGVTLQGAGVDSTIIDVQADIRPIYVRVDEPLAWRITGFTFQGGIVNGGIILVSGNSKSWRVDHNKFDNIVDRSVSIGNFAYGVIDNNEWVYTGLCSTEIQIEESPGDYGHAAWTRPMTWGTAYAVYVEDNTWNCGEPTQGRGAFDGSRGGRVVFRHNTLFNQKIGWHGMDSGNARGFISAEVYNNTFDNDGSMARTVNVRSGSLVIFNNTVSGSWGNLVDLNLHRCFMDYATSWRICDGTEWMLCESDLKQACTSSSDCPGGSCNTMFCSVNVDAMCVEDIDCPDHPNETCTRYLDGSGGYPCRDQPGRGSPHQAPEPIYSWNNSFCNTGTGCVPVDNAGMVGVPFHDDYCVTNDLIQENREYHNNVEKPGYVSFVYPHPLR